MHIIKLAMLGACIIFLTACQTTRGISGVPKDVQLNIPQEVHLVLILPESENFRQRSWINEFSEFIPKERIHFFPHFPDVPNAHVVTLRISSHPVDFSLGIVPWLYGVYVDNSGIAFLLIPICHANELSADFEDLNLAKQTDEHFKAHYEISDRHCEWIPLWISRMLLDSKSHDWRHEIFRQFFYDLKSDSTGSRGGIK